MKRKKLNKIQYTGFWSFICNPKYWNIQKFLDDLANGVQSEIDTWRITDWQSDYFDIGQYGIVRVGRDYRTKKELNGKQRLESGIYAIVKIISLPKADKNEEINEEYWKTGELVERRKKYVEIEFLSNFIDNPIRIDDIKSNAILSLDNYLINGFQGSSIPLKERSFNEIIKLSKYDLEITKKDIYYKNIEKEFSETINKAEIDITEREKVIKSRIGQSKFKNKLITYECCCKICGLRKENLLIASHIKPWSDSESYERIDFYNGFLLCPNHDYLFDKGYISFGDKGEIIISHKLDVSEYKLLNINSEMKINILEEHKKYMKWHRERVFQK